MHTVADVSGVKLLSLSHCCKLSGLRAQLTAWCIDALMLHARGSHAGRLFSPIYHFLQLMSQTSAARLDSASVSCCAAAMMLSGPYLSMCDRTVYLLGHLRTLVSACVLLILGKWLYSSKPSDVTDLFWTGSRNSRTATAAGAGGQECRLLVRPSVRPEAWAEWRLILSQEAETAALLFHGSGTGSESVVVVMVGGGGWNYLVRCQSSQHFGMQHSKRSTPRCFLSPPAHIHHPESCQPYCCVCMCVSLFFILSRKTPPTNTMFHQVHEDNV